MTHRWEIRRNWGQNIAELLNINDQMLPKKIAENITENIAENIADRLPQWPTDEKSGAIREKRPIHGEEKIPLSWPNQSEIMIENLKIIHFWRGQIINYLWSCANLILKMHKTRSSEMKVFPGIQSELLPLSDRMYSGVKTLFQLW